MSNNKRWYLRHRESKSVEMLLQSEQCEDLVMRGPITPDHVIRSKGWPMIVRFPESLKEQDLSEFLKTKLTDFAEDYKSYFKENNDGSKVMLDTLPRVLLLEGVGLVTAGTTIKAVVISLIFMSTVPTILSTARMGEYVVFERWFEDITLLMYFNHFFHVSITSEEYHSKKLTLEYNSISTKT